MQAQPPTWATLRGRVVGAAAQHRLHDRQIFRRVHADGILLDLDQINGVSVFQDTKLLERFGEHWPVLLSYLVLFKFVYPDRRSDIPDDVMNELMTRQAAQQPEPANPLGYGTLLSREQYLFDLDQLGYTDARLHPHGEMTPEQAEIWTKAIGTRR